MATLTITTAGGTTHTYPGLTAAEAQGKSDALKRAISEHFTYWSIQQGTTTHDFIARSVTSISVDAA